jgi:uncharacterized membrane protein YidH (DUF202 family)
MQIRFGGLLSFGYALKRLHLELTQLDTKGGQFHPGQFPRGNIHI